MVFLWIRDSVLHCFCKSCKAASIADQKPNIIIHGMVDKKMMPSKRVVFATEIRASEEKKGGLKYELVLADPAENPPAKVGDVSPPKTPISVENIQSKLKAAEERRRSMEAQKLNQLSEKLNKLNEVTQKKQESINNFVEVAKKNHVMKMESNKENREALEKARKEKLKEHDKHVLQVRQINEENSKEQEIIGYEKLSKKLEEAENKRLSYRNSQYEKLLEHDRHIESVRQNKLAASENGNSSG